ncbi:MAG: hypothetical protein IT422_04975 [Pirellulaceae bacterium]|nr:hypothetical protein [Pirellulaceae bacterium]
MEAWKNNKTLQFAVGVTLVVLLVRWLLTGDLLFAARTAAEPPQEGETKSVAILSVLWPMFFEAMVILGASAIAWACKLWDWLYGLVNQSDSPQTDPTTSASTTTAIESQQPMSVDSLVQGLARAAATNDTATMAKLKVQIRKPYALDELAQAYNDGDAKRAEKLTTELNSMINAKGQS